MSKPNQPPSTLPSKPDDSAPSNRSQHANFIRLDGKSTLYESIRDAETHIVAVFRLSPVEVKTGMEETQAECLLRVATSFPRIRPKDLALNALDAEQEEFVEGIRESEELNEEERATAAETIAAAYLEDNLQNLILFNESIEDQNEVLKELRKEESKLRHTLPDRRRDAARWCVEELMTVDVRRAVELDPEFLPVSSPEFSSVFEIFKICKILYSDQTNLTKSVRQYHAQGELAKVRQTGPSEYVAFSTRFSDAVTAWRSEGAAPDDELLISIYVDALDPKLFYQVQEDFKVPHKRKAYPKVWNEFKRETTAIYNEYHKGGGTTKDPDNLLVLKTNISDKEKPTCLKCCKKHNGECFDTDAIKERYEAEMAVANAAKERYDSRRGVKDRKAVRCVKLRSPRKGDEAVEAKVFDSLKQQGVRADEIDFIFDCAAECTLTADSSICIKPIPVDLIIEGAIPGEIMRASIRMEFLHGLGTPLLAGDRNVISDYEISSEYEKKYASLHCVVLTRKDDPACTWDFIRDPERYGDLFYHCTVKKKDYLSRGVRDKPGEGDCGTKGARDKP